MCTLRLIHQPPSAKSLSPHQPFPQAGRKFGLSPVNEGGSVGNGYCMLNT
jgi:hypothetical protein